MYFLQKNDEKFAVQLTNFSSKLPGYKDIFSISEAELAEAEADSLYFTWAVTSAKKITDYKKSWIGFKNILRLDTGNPELNPVPETSTITPIPDEVLPGIQSRFLIQAKRIKAHKNYTEAIGQNLGIEGTFSNRMPLENVQPILKAVMNGGRVNLQWKKSTYDAIIIEKDTGSGFVFLDKDLRPNFVDTTPLPSGSESAVWRYRAMYMFKDEKVGNWSDVVTITVGD
ncbi:MAG: hypothetical protein DCF13_12115 [Flavobacteriaceae bacterium]|nr:MAG: hypothetical protein DCF13_12115 [Flavobacteriaceae bacterium]